jgi:hypothetical protein
MAGTQTPFEHCALSQRIEVPEGQPTYRAVCGLSAAGGQRTVAHEQCGEDDGEQFHIGKNELD